MNHRLNHITRLALLTILLLAAAAPAQTVNVTLYHTSDIHEQTRNLPRIAALVRSQKKSNPNILLIDSGDWFNRGDTGVMYTRGEAMIHLLAATGYDALTMGNHDPSFGAKRLAVLFDRYKLPVVSANITWPAEHTPKTFKPYRIFKLKGVTVGVIGVTTPGINHRLDTLLLKFASPTETLKKLVPQVRKEADIVVVVSHLGAGWDINLAESIPGIDVILGGHDHRHFRKEIRSAGGGRTAIQHDYAYGVALGQVIVVYDTKAKRIVKRYQFSTRVKPSLPEDKQVKAVRETYLAALRPTLIDNAQAVDHEQMTAWLADAVADHTQADAVILSPITPPGPPKPKKGEAPVKNWTPPPALPAGKISGGALVRATPRRAVHTFTVEHAAALDKVARQVSGKAKRSLRIVTTKAAKTKAGPLKVAIVLMGYDQALNAKTTGLDAETVKDLTRVPDVSTWQIAVEYAKKAQSLAGAKVVNQSIQIDPPKEAP